MSHHMMSESFTVFSSNAIVLDHSMYQLWLLGRTVEQAVDYRRRHLSSPQKANQRLQKKPSSSSIASSFYDASNADAAQQQTAKQTGAADFPVATTIVRNYVLSQYRNFELLEHYLHRPVYFADQFLLPMSLEMKAWLVERYYHFDQSVIREFLGKKLNSRSRKDLDEVCEKTKVPLGSCRRQFDNLKRIMKRVEDVEGRPVADDIEEKFMLTKEQASQYAHVIFINNNRLDTTHKKLRTYTFLDFEYCASVLKRYWTSQSIPTLEEFDATLSQDSRDLKPIILNFREPIDEFRNLVVTRISSRMPNPEGGTISPGALQHVVEKLPSLFKPLVRNLLVLGSGVGHAKETRDIFVSVIEKIAEPCLSAGIGPIEFDAVLQALASQFSQIESVGLVHRKRFGPSFVRVVEGVRGIGLRLMKKHPSFVKRMVGSAGFVKSVTDVVLEGREGD